MNDSVELTVNGKTHHGGASSTVASLLASLALDPRLVAVEVNRQIVPREAHSTHQLASGDHVEIVTLVGGG